MVQLCFSDAVEKAKDKAEVYVVEVGMRREAAIRKAVDVTAGDRSEDFRSDLYSVLDQDVLT